MGSSSTFTNPSRIRHLSFENYLKVSMSALVIYRNSICTSEEIVTMINKILRIFGSGANMKIFENRVIEKQEHVSFF